MIAGHGRHGKDTVCEILRDDYGMTFQSSSQAAADHSIFDILKKLLGYKTSVECYEDRSNHRVLWYELIKAINHRSLTTLATHIYKNSHIYCGIRDRDEFLAIKKAKLFDVSIWVDASGRHPPESLGSCSVTKDDMDLVIYNNGTIEELKDQISMCMKTLTLETTPHGNSQSKTDARE